MATASCDADLVRPHDDRLESRTDRGSEPAQHVGLLDPRLLVAKKHAAVAHRDHVVVEHAGVDRVRMLLRENGAGRVEAMVPRDRLARFPRLPRRILARTTDRRIVGGAAVDEELDAGRPSGAGEARVVRRAFVAELRCRGQRVMHHERARVGEDRAQDARRRRRLDRAMEMRHEIRRREVDAAVRRVGRGLTVAALATHIAAADEHAASIRGASRAARASTCGVGARRSLARAAPG